MAQYSFVAFDEATDFEEIMITFMLSRMRNANVTYTPQMFLCTNPNYDSFLRLWIQDFYLDVEGIPIAERSNVERYFVLQDNRPVWYNSKEEAEKIHGTGTDNGVRSFRSIKANVRDNIPLLRNQPEYLSNLMALPRVQRLIMLEGSWFARPETLGYFKRQSVNMVKFPVTDPVKRVISFDVAFSEPSEAYPNPDYTAWVVMSKSKENRFTVESVGRMRKKVHDVEAKIFELAKTWGESTVITIPVDPNAQASAYARDLQRRLAEQGYVCKLCRPVKSKIVRFQPFAAACESGFVDVVEGDWNSEFFEELEWFIGDGKRKDDQVDAVSDSFYTLNRTLLLPQFTLPDLSQAPIF